jgi:hypothetical protein
VFLRRSHLVRSIRGYNRLQKMIWPSFGLKLTSGRPSLLGRTRQAATSKNLGYDWSEMMKARLSQRCTLTKTGIGGSVFHEGVVDFSRFLSLSKGTEPWLALHQSVVSRIHRSTGAILNCNRFLINS